MRIENHKLTADDDSVVDLSHKWAPGRNFELNPTHIVLHYDVCHSIDMNTSAQFSSGLFYHVAIDGSDRDKKLPEVRQYTQFDRIASHVRGWNDRAIGIVIVNPGPTPPSEDGTYRTVYGKEWPASDVVEGVHKSGSVPGWTHWASYSHEERDTVVALCQLLASEYPSIKTICGHDHLDPGRKFDPGPIADEAIFPYIRAALPEIEVP